MGLPITDLRKTEERAGLAGGGGAIQELHFGHTKFQVLI